MNVFTLEKNRSHARPAVRLFQRAATYKDINASTPERNRSRARPAERLLKLASNYEYMSALILGMFLCFTMRFLTKRRCAKEIFLELDSFVEQQFMFYNYLLAF